MKKLIESKKLTALLMTLLIVSILLVAYNQVKPGCAQITAGQTAHGSFTSQGTATNFTVTLTSAPTSGDLLVGGIGVYDPTDLNTISGISQTGVTWTRQINYAQSGIDAEIWAGVVVSSASTPITITLTDINSDNDSNCQYAFATIREYSGLLASGFLDKTATNSSVSSLQTDTGTTSITTLAGETWIGAIATNSTTNQGSPTNSNFTEVGSQQTNSFGNFVYLQNIVNATGAANAGTILTSAAAWSGCIATFFAAAPVATPTPAPTPTATAAPTPTPTPAVTLTASPTLSPTPSPKTSTPIFSSPFILIAIAVIVAIIAVLLVVTTMKRRRRKPSAPVKDSKTAPSPTEDTLSLPTETELDQLIIPLQTAPSPAEDTLPPPPPTDEVSLLPPPPPPETIEPSPANEVIVLTKSTAEAVVPTKPSTTEDAAQSTSTNEAAASLSTPEANVAVTSLSTEPSTAVGNEQTGVLTQKQLKIAKRKDVDPDTLEIEVDPNSLDYLQKNGEVYIITDVQNPQFSYLKIKSYNDKLTIKFVEFVEICKSIPDPETDLDNTQTEFTIKTFNVTSPSDATPADLQSYVANSGFSSIDDWLKTLKEEKIPACRTGKRKMFYLYHIETVTPNSQT